MFSASLKSYLYSTLCSNDTIYWRIGEGIETPVGASHEVRFEEISTVSVVLELALVELHRQVGRLEVQGHHLAARVPEHLEIKIGDKYAIV